MISLVKKATWNIKVRFEDMLKLPDLTLELIKRYEKNGPRYTSYPTAKQFHQSFNESHYRQIASRTNEDLIPRDLSLYFHIPFCHTVCFYCACNKIITANKKHAVDYLKYLFMEIELQGKLFDRDRTVQQMHWGGGTPTYLTPGQIQALFEVIRSNFNLRTDDEGDYSIEIDQRQIELDTVSLLRELGFNRISFGVQDFDEEVQKAVNRLQSRELTSSLINKARVEDFCSINVDLIYGLPLQTVDSFSRTLDEIIAMEPDRLAIYNYAHMPHLFKIQKNILEKEIPGSKTKLDILKQAIKKLQAAGYEYIGMDHFAKRNDELFQAQKSGDLHRSFQGYTTHGDCDLVGMGVSAISRVGDSYCQNMSVLEDYKQMIHSGSLAIKHGYKLDADDCLRRDVIAMLVCHFHLVYELIEDLYGIDFHEYFYNEMLELKEMEKDGLLLIERDKLTINALGRLMIRNICMVFDKYINTEKDSKTYSKVI